MSSSPAIVLITGGNTGLGLEIVFALCRSSTPYTILLGSRSLAKGQEAIASVPPTESTLTPVSIDIESDDSIAALFEHVSKEHGRIDVLINNAGAQFDPQLAQGKMGMRQMWNATWDVNITGTHILTSTFAPLLIRSSTARLLFITSGTSTVAEAGDQKWAFNQSPKAGWPKAPQGAGVPAYRSAKTALNMLMHEWARILGNDGVKVWAISPGFLATGLAGVGAEKLKSFGAEDPALGGDFVRAVVEGERDADVGKVVRRSGVQPW